MSFDNFQLSPFLLQEMYKDYLIDLDNGQIIADSLKSGNIPFQGKNACNILILALGEKRSGLADQDKGFLIGILKACGLNMADVALVEIINGQTYSYEELTKQFSPEKVICFGIGPSDIGLPMHFPNYQVQSFNHEVYVTAPVLSSLAIDVEEKKKLWNSLKKLFNL